MSSDRYGDDEDLGVDELSALAKQLDPPAPDGLRVEELRASLLRSASEGRRVERARWPFVVGGFSAGALAAAAAAMFVLHRAPATAPGDGAATDHRAQIEASAAADFERQITHGAKGDDEIVRLHAGRISVAVSPLARGDRVRVAANNGEIEGEGLYEVSVTGDAIHEVRVKRGVAHVRIAGQQEVFLAAGQAWQAPVITADVNPAVPRVQTPTPATGTATPARVERPLATYAAPLTTPRVASAPVTSLVTQPDSAHAAVTRSPGHDELATAPRVARAEPAATPAASIAAGTRATTPIAHAPPASSPASPPASTTPAVPELRMVSDTSVAGPAGDLPPTAIRALNQPDKRLLTALEQHFAAGWNLLRAGKADDAARELAAAAEAGGDDPLAGDARYFQAIALTRAGRKTEAEHALVAFLDRAPHAVRRGRAAVMLARLIAERGDRAAARTWFESATHDPDAEVVAAARAGLEATAHP